MDEEGEIEMSRIIGVLNLGGAGKVAEPIRANVRLSKAPSHQMSICEVERVVNDD